MRFPLEKAWCGIYLHIPFCLSKCHYCDFLSFPGRPEEEMESYVRVLLWEMRTRIPEVLDRFSRFTLYLGGGSPTVLPLRLLAEILETSRRLIPRIEEITVETNPFAVKKDMVSLFRDMGVTRVSTGVQSFNQEVLETLGRSSGRTEIVNALELLKGQEFVLSLDLIYGAPHQDQGVVVSDLEQAMEFQPQHISSYSLTLEGDVPLQRAVKRGDCRLPDDGQWESQFFAVKDFLERNGYQHYEISNFAKDGNYCLHNLIYWSNGSYLGIGAGAASHMNGRRWSNTSKIGSYLSKNLHDQTGEILNAERKASETAMLMLRTRWGIPSDHPLCHRTLLGKTVETLCNQGLLEQKANAFTIPRKLLPVANEVLSLIIAEP